MRMIFDSSRTTVRGIWTISNLLSISRIILVIPIGILLSEQTLTYRLIAVLFMLAAVATDFLDGYIARIRDEVTELGKILDPLADKIAIGIAVLILMFQKFLPVWFVLSVIGRDLLILVGGLLLTRKNKIVLQSNWIGKWTAGCIALTVITSVMKWEVFTNALIWISIFMLCWSLLSYTNRFLNLNKEQVQ